MTTFPARYRTGCIACEHTIHEGDQVKWADGQVIHAECLVLDESMRPVPAVCPTCFMVPASNGTCGCEDDHG